MRLFLIAALLIALPAHAGTLAGNWAVRSHGRVILLLQLEQRPEGWRGTLLQPRHFLIDTNFNAFSELDGVAERAVLGATPQADGSLDLLIADRDAPEHMGFRLAQDGTARLTWQGFPGEFVLDRAYPAERPIRFDPAETYPLDGHWPTNAEMTALFDADQKAREDWEHADHARIAAEDAVRRARARALLDAGALQSGADFYHAAFLFQHGDTADDYLLAHALAMAAQARGYPAGWIAAASLDRYLQRTGRPQIFDTQYRSEGGGTTQAPFAPALIPDALRQALNVPARVPAEPR